MADISATIDVFLKASLSYVDSFGAFLEGATPTTDNQSAYLTANVASLANQSVYVEADSPVTRSSIYAFISGSLRASVSAFVDGYSPGQPPEGSEVAVDHIWLKTSDAGATKSKKFRVVAQGFNDGQLDKAETLDRTVGGGLDHSMGAVYRSWNPTIKVREEEDISDYGDTQDLKDFYGLIDPGGTPSNIITLIDHHQETIEVRMHGSYRSQTLGTSIEGLTAWTLVQLRLLEVPA